VSRAIVPHLKFNTKFLNALYKITSIKEGVGLVKSIRLVITVMLIVLLSILVLAIPSLAVEYGCCCFYSTTYGDDTGAYTTNSDCAFIYDSTFYSSGLYGDEAGLLDDAFCNEVCTSSSCTLDGTVIPPQESCEPGILPITDCAALSPAYISGPLACTNSCTYDTSNCIETPSSCGNGSTDAYLGEECDPPGSLVGACPTGANNIICGENCLEDDSACYDPYCGDDIINRVGEQCDGVDMPANCQAVDISLTGTIQCTDACLLNLSLCTGAGVCTQPGSFCSNHNPGRYRECTPAGEWGSEINCPAGQTCSHNLAGQATCVPGCTNECEANQCFNTSQYQVCAPDPVTGCNILLPPQSCGGNQLCSGGACAAYDDVCGPPACSPFDQVNVCTSLTSYNSSGCARNLTTGCWEADSTVQEFTCPAGFLCNNNTGTCSDTCNDPQCGYDGQLFCFNDSDVHICELNTLVNPLGCLQPTFEETCPTDLTCFAGACVEQAEVQYKIFGYVNLEDINLALPGSVVDIVSWVGNVPRRFRFVTDPLGSYERFLPPFKDYYVTASRPQYISANGSVFYLDSSERLDFDLARAPLYEISGTVKNDTADLSGITITISDNETISTAAGYSFRVFPGVYTITATDDTGEYAPASATISVSNSTTYNFILSKVGCTWFTKTPPHLNPILPIEDQAKLALSWEEFCPTYSYDLYRCEGSGCTPEPYIPGLSTTTYEDDIEAETDYCYQVIAWHDAINGVSSESNQDCFFSDMSEQCMAGNASYCENDILYACGVDNVPDAQDAPVGFICVETDSGPEYTYDADCASCGGIFNMFDYSGTITTTLLSDEGFDVPGQIIDCSDASICFNDRTLTTRDAYRSLTEIESCYDYRSETTCDEDLSVGPCAWTATSGFAELGKGVCHPTDVLEQDCGLCHDDLGEGCTVNTCNSYGTCYWNEEETIHIFGVEEQLGCVGYSESYCELYDSQIACLGSGKNTSLNPDNSRNPSEDIFDFGTCAWKNDVELVPGVFISYCYKDSDANRARDCAVYGGDPITCMQDNKPPLTSISHPNETRPDRFTFPTTITDVHEAETYYCVSNQTSDCLPNDPSLPSVSAGDYSVHYYSMDAAQNKEIIKHFNITVDDDVAMNLNMSKYAYNILDGDGDLEWHTDVLFTLTSNETVMCNTSINTLHSPDQIIHEQIGTRFIQQFSGLPDGDYEYRWDCVDEVGNEQHGKRSFHLAADEIIYNILPAGTINYNNPIELKAYTYYDANCSYADYNAAYTDMTPMSKISINAFEYEYSHTLSLSYVNRHMDYWIKCEITDPDTNITSIEGNNNHKASFTIDVLEPNVDPYHMDGGSTFPEVFTDWQNKNNFRLICNDPVASGGGEYECQNLATCIGFNCEPIPSTDTDVELTSWLGYAQYLSFNGSDGHNDNVVVNQLVKFDELAPIPSLTINPIFKGNNKLVTNNQYPLAEMNVIDYAYAADLPNGKVALEPSNFNVTGVIDLAGSNEQPLISFRASDDHEYLLKVFLGSKTIGFFRDGSTIYALEGYTQIGEQSFTLEVNNDQLTLWFDDDEIVSVTDNVLTKGYFKFYGALTEVKIQDLDEELVSGTQYVELNEEILNNNFPQSRTLALTNGSNNFTFFTEDVAINNNEKTFEFFYDDKGPNIDLNLSDHETVLIAQGGNAEYGTRAVASIKINDDEWTNYETGMTMQLFLGTDRNIIPIRTWQLTGLDSISIPFTGLVNDSGNATTLQPGEYLIVVNATDYFGNNNTEAHYFLITDTVPPVFTVDISPLELYNNEPLLRKNQLYNVTVTSSEPLLAAPIMNFTFNHNGQQVQWVVINQTTLQGTINTSNYNLRALDHVQATFHISGFDTHGAQGNQSNNTFYLHTVGKEKPTIIHPIEEPLFTSGSVRFTGFAPKPTPTSEPEAELFIKGFMNDEPVGSYAFFSEEYNAWEATKQTRSAPNPGAPINKYSDPDVPVVPVGSTNLSIIEICDGVTSNSYVSFSNHKRATGEFYPVISCVGRLLTLAKPLEQEVISNELIDVYSAPVPQGWFNLTFPVTDEGTHNIYFVAYDENGVIGDDRDARSIIYDSFAPSIELSYPTPDTISSSNITYLEFTITDNASAIEEESISFYLIKDDNGTITPERFTCGPEFSCIEINPQQFNVSRNVIDDPYTAGRYYIYFNASDVAGNLQQTTTYFEVNPFVPGTPNVFISDSTPRWEWARANENSHIFTRNNNPDISLYFYHGDQYIDLTGLFINEFNIMNESTRISNYSFSIDNIDYLLPENGDVNLQIRARKQNGTDATGDRTFGPPGIYMVTVTVDRIDPDLTVSTPYRGKCTTSNCDVRLNGSYVETNPFYANITGELQTEFYYYSLLNPFEEIISLQNFFDGNYSLNGTRELTVTLVDKAGNIGREEITAVIDTEPPTISIEYLEGSEFGELFLVNGTYKTNMTQLVVHGTNSLDAKYFIVERNSVCSENNNITLASNVFQYLLPCITVPPMNEFTYQFNFTAYDDAMNNATTQLTVHVDRKGPEVNFTSPSHRINEPLVLYANASWPFFLFETDEPAICSISYYPVGVPNPPLPIHTEVEVIDTDYAMEHNYRTMLQPATESLFIIICTDELGNTENSGPFSLFLDNDGPTIQTWGLSNGLLLNESLNEREYAVWDAPYTYLQLTMGETETSCRYDFFSTNYADMEWSFADNGNTGLQRTSERINLTEDAITTIHVACADFVGNQMTTPYSHYTYHVLLDTDSPVRITNLTINNLPTGSYINRPTALMQATTARANQCRFNGSWSPFTQFWYDLTGQSSMNDLDGDGVFQSFLTLDDSRQYRIDVTCEHTTLNIDDATAYISFTTDFTTSIGITSPLNNSFFNEPLVDVTGVTGEDEEGIVTISVREGVHEQEQFSTPVSDGAFATQALLLTDGENIIKASIRDRANNYASDQVRVLYVMRGPIVDIRVGINGLTPTSSPQDNFYARTLESATIQFLTVDSDFVMNNTDIYLTDSNGDAVSYTRTQENNRFVLHFDPLSELETYYLVVITRNDDGEAGSARLVTIVVNPNVPAIHITDPSYFETNDATILFGGSVDPYAEEVFLDIYNSTGYHLGTVQIPHAGGNIFSYVLGSQDNIALVEGRNDYVIRARVSDQEGAAASYVYLYTTSPEITNISIT